MPICGAKFRVRGWRIRPTTNGANRVSTVGTEYTVRPYDNGHDFRVTRLRMERVLSRACGRLGGPTVALKLREATPNEHGLKAARPCDNGHDLRRRSNRASP